MDDNYQKRRLPSPPLNLIGWVAASVAILVTFSYAVSAEKSPELRPPPLTFVLEVAGTPIPVELDKAFEVNVNGKKVSMKLTAEPFRVFRAAGIHFKYPRDHAFAVDTDSPGVTTWSIDGSDNVITIIKYPKADKESILAEITTTLVQQFGAVNVKQSDVEITLPARRLKGKRLDITLATIQLRQDIYAFSSIQGTIVLVIQDCPNEDGSPSKETVRATKLLRDSFQAGK